jgi:hypothetical protein
MARSRNTADTQTASGGPVSPSIAGKNAIINGGMDIWQRGTTFALALNVPTYTADRWYNARSATGQTVSRQATGDTTNLPNIQYCARVQRDNANTSTAEVRLAQAFETVNSIPLAGQVVTLSFYARRGANYSAASNLIGSQIIIGTGTDQNALTSGYTGQSTLSSATPTLTTTWQRFTQTATIPATATEITTLFTYTPIGTAGAADYFEVTGVQLELGSVATPFSRAGGTIQGELLACMRYYYLLVRGNGNYIPFSNGYQFSSTQVTGITPFPVAMRTAPTLDMSGGTDYYLFSRNGANDFWNTCISDGSSTTTGAITVPSNISGTAGNGGAFYSATANTGTGYIAWSAEL